MHGVLADMAKPILTYAVTGHRPDKLGGYSDGAFLELYMFARRTLTHYKPGIIVTGMALGWDTAIACACRTVGIPYIAAAPFPGQEKKWNPVDRDLYKELWADADQALFVCDGGYAPWKMQRRNKYMVDISSVVIALWNGSPGGTANCVKYAESCEKKIINVWPAWERFLAGKKPYWVRIK